MRRIRTAILGLTALILVSAASAQNDWIRTGTGLGQEKVRLAVADFKSSGADPRTDALLKTFNDTLWTMPAYSTWRQKVSIRCSSRGRPAK